MGTIETIYILSSTFAICGSLPQIKQVLVTKRTDELSTTTWSIWTLTQIVSLTYALSINAKLLVLTNSVWVIFYAVMLGLIYYYRKPKALNYSYEFIDADTLDRPLSVVLPSQK